MGKEGMDLTINEIFKEIMEEGNIRPADLAKRLGLTNQAMNSRLKHKNISLNVLIDVLTMMDYKIDIIPVSVRNRGYSPKKTKGEDK